MRKYEIAGAGIIRQKGIKKTEIMIHKRITC